MKWPFTPDLSQALLQNNTDLRVGQAHALLTNQNYAFIGYHGTNGRGMAGILLNGFDRAFAGSSAGLARGQGLYVARSYQMALDFSDTATQAGDPDPITGIIPRRPGLAATAVVLRVYVRNFESMREGVHYVWGRMGGTSLAATAANLLEQEIVLRPATFQQILAIPTTLAIETILQGPARQSTPPLRSHEAPF